MFSEKDKSENKAKRGLKQEEVLRFFLLKS